MTTRMGRPPIYRPDYHPRKAKRLALLGLSDAEIARTFDVSPATIVVWKNLHLDFLNALAAGREDADSRVSTALFKRAIGYKHDDLYMSNFQGNVTATPIKKHVQPDVGAQIFWLTNRASSRWKREPDQQTAMDPAAIAAALRAELAKVDGDE